MQRRRLLHRSLILAAFLVVLTSFLAACGKAEQSKASGAVTITELPATPTPTEAPPTPTATPSPTPTATPTPTPAVTRLEATPTVLGQGQSFVLRLVTDGTLKIEGAFQGQPLRFAPTDDGYWAVVPVPVEAQPRMELLEVKATGENGESYSLGTLVQVKAVTFEVERIDLPPSVGGLLAPATVQNEVQLLTPKFASFRPAKLWKTSFLLPVEGPISSPFAAGRSYNGGPVTGRHEGVDFAVDEGTPILAAASGKVALARELAVRGNAVLLDHSMVVFSAYYHMSELGVKEGDEVTKGQVIGWVGQTGLSTGPHLHWELRVNGVALDPMSWVEPSASP